MKKFMERMAQIAYSINLVNGFDTEVEVFACTEKLLSWPKAFPCIRLGAGGFLCYVAPKFLRQKLPACGHYFLYRNHTKRG